MATNTAQTPIKKKKRRWFNFSAGFDMPFFILTMLVLAVGLVSLFSASFAYAYYWNDGDSYYYIKRQLIFAAIGVVFMLAASTLNYKQLQKKWVVQAALGIAVVLLLWVRFIAPPIRNVHR